MQHAPGRIRPPSALRETFPSGFNQGARSLERQSIIADWFVLRPEFHNNLAGAEHSQFYSSMETLIAAYFTPSSTAAAADNFLPSSPSRTVLFKFLPGVAELGPFRFSFSSPCHPACAPITDCQD